MKLKCFALLFLLGAFRANLTVSSIDESKVKSYSVWRRKYQGDLFTFKMKDGHVCPPKDKFWKWCDSFSASEKSWQNGSCSCTCLYATRCFLPSLKACINTTIAHKFGDCHSYFKSQSLLQDPVDLKSKGSKTTSIVSEDSKVCKLHGQYFEYNGFQARWKNITDGENIFSLKTKGKISKEFVIEWDKDRNGKFSGRIIRLNFTCFNESGQAPLLARCMLFKAVGTVTYSFGSSKSASSFTQSSYPAVPTSISSITHSSPLLSPPTTPSPTSSPSSSLVFAVSTKKLRSTSTGILTVSTSVASQSKSLHRRPAFATSGPDLSQLMTEHQSLLPVYSEGAFSHLVSTGILNTIISTPYSIEPSKSSLAAEASSRSDIIDGPGNKKARTSGNDNGTVIGATVGGAVVFGIFIIVIIVFFKRRKLGNGKDKPTKLQVKNPTYGSSDIPLSSATQKPVTTSVEQDSQPTYQDLITGDGKLGGEAIYNNPDDDDYDNYNAYQSLDKKVPGSPVYQSLAKGQSGTGKPTPKSKPSVTGPPEKGSGDSDEHTQEPVYNVLYGSASEENYEAGDSLYNVLEEPESIEDQQQPLYNVLESSDAEKSSHQGAQGSCGLSNEPLYNVVEGPDSDRPNEDGVGYDGPNGSSSSDGHDNLAYEESLNFGPSESGVSCAAPNGSSSPDAHDNPAYEQSLDFDVPYASVQRPGSQRESVYEPLRGPNDQSLYEPLK